MTETAQQTIDERNAAFWDELCGTSLAQSIGVTDRSPESLRRFDEAYMDLYPYLPAQLRPPREPGEPLLEIGLGYGTVSQQSAEAGFAYPGLDIAQGPADIVRERLRMLGRGASEQQFVRGSALDTPHPDGTFGHVVSIGCLHPHRRSAAGGGGGAPRSPAGGHGDGDALQPSLLVPAPAALAGTEGRFQRVKTSAYDANAAGDAAPEAVFVTARQVRAELFAGFADIRVERHNSTPSGSSRSAATRCG